MKFKIELSEVKRPIAHRDLYINREMIMYYGNNRMVFGKKRIRLVIWMFWAFEIVMLFQTNYYNLGTIVSGALCGLIVFTYLLETHYVKVSKENVIIFLYMLVLVGGDNPNY